MKLKCKRCYQKFKVRGYSDIKCDKSDCDLKYNMTSEVLNFGYDFEEDLLKEVKVVTHWETDKVVPTGPVSNEQWAAWCENNLDGRGYM